MWARLPLYYHTLKYLKPVQLYYRLYYTVRSRWRGLRGVQRHTFRVGPLPAAPPLPDPLPPASRTYLGGNRFRFLNLDKDFGETIDWDYGANGKLWTYNLNYFEFLLQEDVTERQGRALIKAFLEAAPDLKNAWEPYPLSLRIIHWIKFIARHELRDQILSDSLRAQADALLDQLEYHLLGNHLLENGFALLFAACYFDEPRYHRAALNILEPQLREQVLADGGHFELSPMYHQLMLWRMLDCCNLLAGKRGSWSAQLPWFQATARRMLSWLQQLTFTDGSIPLLNDAAPGINPTTPSLLAYATRLGLSADALPLGASGYRKLGTGRFEVLFDVGAPAPDYIPGHAHCDALSVAVHYAGRPLLVDRGVSTYEPNAQRYLERSTSAHNTVSVAGREQAEIWASFRLGRRRVPVLLVDEPEQIQAQLRYATSDHWHRRTVRREDEAVVIEDAADAPAQAYFHFSPDLVVEQTAGGVRAGTAELTFEGATAWTVETYAYAAGFNALLPAHRAVVQFSTNLTSRLTPSRSSS